MATDTEISVRISASIADLKAGMDASNKAIADAVSSMKSSFDDFAKSNKEALEAFSKNTKKAAEESKSQFDEIRESVKHLVESLGLIEGAHMFVDLVREGAEMGEQLERLSSETGASVEALSQLKFAAAATGTPFDSVAMAIRRTQMELGQLRAGSQDKALLLAMKDFGLQAKDLANFPGLLEKISDSMGHVSQAAARADITTIFGGRGGIEMIPLIQNLRELADQSDRLGATLSDQVVEGAASGRDAMNMLGAVWYASKVKLANDLAPAIVDVSKDLAVLVHDVDALAADHSIERWAKDAQTAFAGLHDLFHAIGIVPADAHEKIQELQADIVNTKERISAEQSDLSGWMLFGRTGEQKQLAIDLKQLLSLRTQLGALTRPEPVPFVGSQKSGKLSLSPTSGIDFSAVTQSAAQIAAAHKKAINDQFQAFREESQLEVSEDRNNSIAKIGSLMNITAEAKTLFGEQSTEFRKAMVAQQNAVDAFYKEFDRQQKEQAAKDKQAINQWVRNWAQAQQQAVQAQREAAQQANAAWATSLEPLSKSVDSIFDIMTSRSRDMGLEWRKMLAGMAKEFISSGIKDLVLGAPKGSFASNIFGVKGAGGGFAGELATTFGVPGTGAGKGSNANQQGTVLGQAFTFAKPAITKVFSEMWTDLKAPITSIFTDIFGSGAGGGVFSGLTNIFGGLLGGGGGGGGGIFSDVMSIAPMALPFLERGGIIPSAAHGVIVPDHALAGGGQLIIGHPNEMMLPAKISSGFQDLFAGRGLGMTIPPGALNMARVPDVSDLSRNIQSTAATSNRLGSPAESATSRSADIHFHHHSVDPRESAAYFSRNSSEIVKALTRAHRNGAI